MRQGEVAVRRIRHAELQHLLIERNDVVNEVHVAHQNDHAFRLGFFQRTVRRLLLVLLFLAVRRRCRRFAFRKGRLEFALQPDGQRVLFVGRLELAHRFRRRETGRHAVHEFGLLRRVQQHRLLQARGRCAAERTRLGEEQVVQLPRQRVFLIDAFRIDEEKRRTVLRLFLLIESELSRESQIRDDLRRVERHAPRGQQLRQRGTCARHHARERIVRLLLLAVEEAHRVQQREQLAAAQHELINRELRLLRDVLRMRHDEHLDVVVNFLGLHWHLPHGVIALEFLNENPRALAPAGLTHALHHRIGRLPEHRQRSHYANKRFVRADDLADRAGNVVFEQALAFQLQRHGHLLRVETDHEAKVKVFPHRSRRLAFDAVGLRGFLGIAVGLRINFADANFSAGRVAELFKQIFDLGGVGADLRRHARLALREIETHFDR